MGVSVGSANNKYKYLKVSAKTKESMLKIGKYFLHYCTMKRNLVSEQIFWNQTCTCRNELQSVRPIRPRNRRLPERTSAATSKHFVPRVSSDGRQWRDIGNTSTREILVSEGDRPNESRGENFEKKYEPRIRK